MTALYKSGQFTRPNDGSIDSTVSDVGFEPVAVLFFAANQADDLSLANIPNMQGAIFAAAKATTPGPNRVKGQGLFASDATAQPAADIRFVGGNFGHLTTGDPALAYQISNIAFNASGFVINWDNTFYDGNEYWVSYLAIGGDVEAFWSAAPTDPLVMANTVFFDGDANGIKKRSYFPEPDFRPDVLFCWLDERDEGTNDWNNRGSFGVWSGPFNNSAASQWTVSYGLNERPITNPTQTSRGFHAGLIAHNLDPGATSTADTFQGRVSAVGPGFVEVEQLQASGANRVANLWFLGIRGVSARAGVFTNSGGASQSVAVGEPAAVLFGSAGMATDGNLGNLYVTFGMTDGDYQSAMALQHLSATVMQAADTWFATHKSLIVGPVGDPTSTVGTTSFTATGFTQTWQANNFDPYKIGYLAFLAAESWDTLYFSMQSAFEPFRFGTPVPLAMTIRAELDFYPQTFGNVGNIAAVPLGGTSVFSIVGIGFDRNLDAVMGAALDFLPFGLTLNHPLAMTIPAVSTFLPIKPGTPAPLGATTIPLTSVMEAIGLKLNHPLGLIVPARAVFSSRFKIVIPTVPDAAIGDMPGTVNLHPNPSAERDLTGWFDETGDVTLITRTAEQVWDGAWSVKRVTTTAAAGQGILARSFAGLEITGLDSKGQVRSINGQIRLMALAPADYNVFARVAYTDGTVVTGDVTLVSVGPEWKRCLAPAVALNPAKIVNYIEIVAATPVALAGTLYADGVQLEENRGSGATDFAIGSYGKDTGSWSGVPHVSFSVRQPIPMLIHGVGVGGEIIVDAKMYRATWDNQWIEDISDMVIDAKVQMDPEREVTWSIDANFTWDGYQRLIPNYDWIAPVLTISYPNGEVKSGQLGLYFLVPGGMERNEYERTVKVSAFDPLWLLAKQGFTGPVKTTPGADRIRVVRDILNGAVLTETLTGVRRYFGPGTNKQWKRSQEWPRKTDRLQLINEILESTAMYPLWSNQVGEIFWRERGQGRMAERQPVRAWAANMPRGAAVDPRIPRVSFLKSEVVGAIKTEAAAMDAYDEILIINDDPDTRRVRVRGRVKGKGNHARVVRGRGDRRRTRTLYAPLVDDEATAAEIAAALADELSNRVERVELAVLPDPSVNYARETVLLAIWDAYGDPVAVGQYEVNAIEWGFTPSTCLQKMKLSYVDNGEAEIVVTVE